MATTSGEKNNLHGNGDADGSWKDALAGRSSSCFPSPRPITYELNVLTTSKRQLRLRRDGTDVLGTLSSYLAMAWALII